MLEKIINLLHYEILYNSQCTGSPGLIHIMKNWNDEQIEGSYCGFNGFAAQNIIIDNSEIYNESDICKKCLRSFIKDNPVKR